MTKKPPITHERLCEALSYDPDSGVFLWVKSSSKKRLNGTVAGTIDPDGYVMIAIDGVRRGAHQWAWFYMTGAWPQETIDHKDRNPSRNRWANLREASEIQQRGNTKIRSDNTSGHKGVSWDNYRKLWAANIHMKGRKVALGRFSSKKDACAAYANAAKEYFGEFAHQ